MADLTVSGESIFFNGDYETFYVQRTAGLDFGFCKTARKPYDRYVVACLLILADEIEDFNWSSDGIFPNEHMQGIEIAGFTPRTAPGPRR